MATLAQKAGGGLAQAAGLEVNFPDEATIEGSKMSELKWLLYGPPGIGKSSFFAKMKGALFLYTDPGLRFIKAMKEPINSWKHFEKWVEALTSRPPAGKYSIIVVDTVDLLFRMCRDQVCRERGIEHISDEEWGKGYDIVRDRFELSIARLARLDKHGIGLAFISHQKEVEVRGRTTRTNKIVPTLPKQGYQVIAPMCDIIGYAGYEAGAADAADAKRLIHFKPSEDVEAKDRTGLLPPVCDLDFNAVRKYLEEGLEPEVEEVEETRPAKPAKRK